MPALSAALRKTLEATVVKARELAERGARAALEELDVAGNSHIASMTAEQERQRRRLRAHGRQLGDQAGSSKGSQSIERLVREMAYEHWHRMLFARFLAENQLLIEPSSGVAISLDECEELAAEEGTDLWGLAAQFAQAMLPQIFRLDDPVLAVKLPLEIRQQLQGLVAGLEEEVFTASDSLGWVYQFWQALEKERVNQSEKKIGAEELPAVTQLFTEPYMVDFLLQNTLGAWWVTRYPGKPCPVDLTYLRTLADGTPAAGKFEGWPNTLKEFTLLDPCCGSGHFLVAAFLLLVPMRMSSEGLRAKEAVDAVLEENLQGLEIDTRCVEIAVFALALTAWRFPGDDGIPLGVQKEIPTPRVAWCGARPAGSKEQWISIIPSEAQGSERLRRTLLRIHNSFAKSQSLGSLLSPSGVANESLLESGIEEVRIFLDQALRKEPRNQLEHESEDVSEMALAAQGILAAANLLDRKYTLVITNVPFKTAIELAKDIKSFLGEKFKLGKANLASAMALRMQELTAPGGHFAYVAPQNWLALKGYEGVRRHYLESKNIRIIARLGDRSFESTGSNGEQISLNIMSDDHDSCSGEISAIDVSHAKSPRDKAELLRQADILHLKVESLIKNRQSIINFSSPSATSRVGDYASSLRGLGTSDSPRFVRRLWEVSSRLEEGDWEFYQSTTSETTLYAGMDYAIFWQKESGELKKLADSVKHSNHGAQNWRRGKPNWGLQGVTISQMGRLTASIYCGNIYDVNCTAIVPRDQTLVPALWLYAESGKLAQAVRSLNQKRSVEVGTFLAAEFDLAYWVQLAHERLPDGLPRPYSNDPTQWLFHGHPRPAQQPLQVSVSRLLGYRWPAETDNQMDLSDAAREWIAQTECLNEYSTHDGIVCLPSVRGELPAQERLSKLLVAAFGDEWSTAKERILISEAAVNNKVHKDVPNLRGWIRNFFFEEHSKVFQGKPFILQIWDGHPTGFSALVNTHKLFASEGLGRKTLELLTFTYLGFWIARQKDDQAEDINGADDRLAAALDLQNQLIKILDGEPPYDIFVRWKPLNQQAIGWEPDINDGVRLNIRPFLVAQLRKGGKTGAGILRAKPGTIEWAKDRGKEPLRCKEEYPWFWGWEENNPALATDFGASVPGAPPAGDSFDGNRWNDLHYSRAAKEAARARQAETP
jgi:hypothetical protein